MQSTGSDHDTSLIYMVGRVNQGIRREMRTRLSQWSLSVQEYTTLSVLDARPGLSNAQLARRALVTPQSMIEILAGLQARGLVRRDVDPDHGRILRAEVTPAGRDILTAADPLIDSIQAEVFASVPPGDRDAAMRTMRAAMVKLSAPDTER